MPAVAAPALQARFGLNDAQLGLLLGPAFAVAFVLGGLMAGRWADRMHRPRLIAWSLLGWGVASAGMALAGRFEHLMAARLALGLGQAALAPAALSLLMQLAPPDRSGRWISVFTAGSALGRSGALLIGGALLGVLASVAAPIEAWRLMFVLTALPNLLLAALLFAAREPERPNSGSPAQDRRAAWAWARSNARVLVGMLAVASAAVVVTQSVALWGPSLLARAAGLPPGRAAVLAGAVVLVAAPLGGLLGGWTSDRMRAAGRSPTTAVALLLALAAAASTSLGWASGAPGLTVAFGLTTAMASAAAVAALAAYQPLIPHAFRGRAAAVYFAAVTLVGLGLGPPLVGLLSDAARGALGASLAAVVAAVALPAATLSLTLGPAWAATARRTGASAP